MTTTEELLSFLQLLLPISALVSLLWPLIDVKMAANDELIPKTDSSFSFMELVRFCNFRLGATICLKYIANKSESKIILFKHLKQRRTKFCSL